MDTTLLRQRLDRANYLLQQMEQIEAELKELFGTKIGNGIVPSKESGPSNGRKKPGMSAAGRARIAAAQKARWAQQKAGVTSEEAPAKPAKGKKKRTMSPEARAKIAAAQKRRWAKQKAGK